MTLTTAQEIVRREAQDQLKSSHNNLARMFASTEASLVAEGQHLQLHRAKLLVNGFTESDAEISDIDRYLVVIAAAATKLVEAPDLPDDVLPIDPT
jgi:hypothetical protein